MPDISYTTNDCFSIQDQILRLNYVTAATGMVSTTAATLNSIVAYHPRRQSVLITNTSANDVYIGFYTPMTSGIGWSYKLTTLTNQTLSIGANVEVYLVASASGSRITIAQGV